MAVPRCCTTRISIMLACSASQTAAAQSPPVSPQPRVANVEWPEQGPVSASATDRPPLAGLDSTKLPVLIPTAMLSDRSLRFVGDETSYTAYTREGSADTPTITVAIRGTRIAFDRPDAQAPATDPPGDVSTEIGAQNASAGYVRFGVAYRIDVECRNSADRRCNRADYARDLLNSLELVGGGRGAPVAVTTMPEAPPPGMISASSLPPGFHRPAGELVAHSGAGVAATTVFVPNMRFPVEASPAYLNSQVYGVGGLKGPRGSAGDPRNYQYPWRDNFCEARSRTTPLCPGGKGHQGQDVRPAGPGAAKYWAVAAERGRIARIGTYSVVLIGASGTEYRYLHLAMHRLAVRAGDVVQLGQKIGLISNDFGATKTTVHLHFEMLQNVDGRGLRHVPPYTSLVSAYEKL